MLNSDVLPEVSAEVLQTIHLDRGCFACALGGADGRTLFLLASEWGCPESMAEGRERGRC